MTVTALLLLLDEQFDQLKQTYKQRILEMLTRAEQLQKYLEDKKNNEATQSGGTGQQVKPKQFPLRTSHLVTVFAGKVINQMIQKIKD